MWSRAGTACLGVAFVCATASLRAAAELEQECVIAWLGEGGAEWLPRFLGGQSDIEAKDEHTVVHPNLSLKDYLRDNGREFARQ